MFGRDGFCLEYEISLLKSLRGFTWSNAHLASDVALVLLLFCGLLSTGF